MKMIVGLIAPSAGEILFDGTPIQHNTIEYKSRIGYVPEEPYLYSHLSGLEYLVMVGQLRNLAARQTSECIDELLHLFGIHGDRDVPISSYSKGMAKSFTVRGSDA